MKFRSIHLLLAISSIIFHTKQSAHAAGTTLRLFPAFEIEYDTEPGGSYQLQSSTNLSVWTNIVDAVSGDGLPASEFVSTKGSPQLYFRLRIVSGQGLAVHLPLNSGSAVDTSTNGNDGVLMSPVATTNRFGKKASALAFDGGSDQVVVSDSTSLNFSNVLSFSFWARFEEGGTFNPRIIHKDTGSTGYQVLTEGTSASRQFNFTVFLEGTGYVGVNSSFHPAGTWHHVAGVFDGTGLEIFINGVSEGTTPASGVIVQTDAPLSIGRNSSQSTDHWRGDIDEVRLYNRALTAEEVGVLFLLQQ